MKLEDITIAANLVRETEYEDATTAVRIVDIHITRSKDKPVVYVVFTLMASLNDSIYESKVGLPIVLNLYDLEHYYNILKDFIKTQPGVIWGKSQKSRIPRIQEYPKRLRIDDSFHDVLLRGYQGGDSDA